MANKEELIEWLKKDFEGALPVPNNVLRHIRDLDSISDQNAKYAIKALRQVGEPAVLCLIKALQHGDMFVSNDAAEVLGVIGDERAVLPLIKVLASGISTSSASYALGKLSDARAVPALIRILGEDNIRYDHEAAAYALGKIKDERAVIPLMEALKESEWRVRAAAARALANFSDARAVLPLIEAFKIEVSTIDIMFRVRLDIVYALGNIGGVSAVVLLTQALNDNSKYVRKEAVKALGNMKNDPILPFNLVTEASLTVEERIDTFEALKRKRYFSVKPIAAYCQSLLERADIEETLKNEVHNVLREIQARSNNNLLLRASNPDDALKGTELLRPSQTIEANMDPEEHLRASEPPVEQTKRPSGFWKRFFKRK